MSTRDEVVPNVCSQKVFPCSPSELVEALNKAFGIQYHKILILIEIIINEFIISLN